MLSKLKSLQFHFLSKMYNSIAFYPAAVTLGFILLAILLLEVDSTGNMKSLMEKHTPYLIINNADTARVILSTLIGGVISLTVFSFSMVMMTLNQASANFSPRLLPGLISEKNNQFVLGFYLGTIVYNLIIIISILPSGKAYTLNVLSIFVGIMLGILCLTLFIYFIHNISNGIQIDNILFKVFTTTKNNIADLKPSQPDPQSMVTQSEGWTTLISQKEGYYFGYDTQSLLSLCDKYDISFHIIIQVGDFIMAHHPILKVSKSLDDEVVDQIIDLFYYSHQNDESSHYIFGIRQITEVGIRAMSPGINDPATAMITLDYLSVLFSERMQVSDSIIHRSEETNNYIRESRNTLCNIISECFSAYRIYASHDLNVMKKLLSILKSLKSCKSIDQDYLICLDNQLKILADEAKNSIENKHDLTVFLDQVPNLKN